MARRFFMFPDPIVSKARGFGTAHGPSYGIFATVVHTHPVPTSTFQFLKETRPPITCSGSIDFVQQLLLVWRTVTYMQTIKFDQMPIDPSNDDVSGDWALRAYMYLMDIASRELDLQKQESLPVGECPRSVPQSNESLGIPCVRACQNTQSSFALIPFRLFVCFAPYRP